MEQVAQRKREWKVYRLVACGKETPQHPFAWSGFRETKVLLNTSSKDHRVPPRSIKLSRVTHSFRNVRLGKAMKPMAMLILHKAEEYTTCIQVDLMQLRVQGQEARERYGRHLHARLVTRRSYAQGMQRFRRDAVLCKCTDLQQEHTFQTTAVECFQDLTLISNTISEHAQMAKNGFFKALYLKMYTQHDENTARQFKALRLEAMGDLKRVAVDGRLNGWHPFTLAERSCRLNLCKTQLRGFGRPYSEILSAGVKAKVRCGVERLGAALSDEGRSRPLEYYFKSAVTEPNTYRNPVFLPKRDVCRQWLASPSQKRLCDTTLSALGHLLCLDLSWPWRNDPPDRGHVRPYRANYLASRWCRVQWPQVLGCTAPTSGKNAALVLQQTSAPDRRSRSRLWHVLAISRGTSVLLPPRPSVIGRGRRPENFADSRRGKPKFQASYVSIAYYCISADCTPPSLDVLLARNFTEKFCIIHYRTNRNWAPVHSVYSVVVIPLESRKATPCGYNSSHPVWHALYECLQDIHGDSSPFLLQPFHELRS
ncbi:hypothetical protein PR048_023999 [Dryococelus australis]|uniref:Uncharacterized protein n=1 Tax=Dryococelus australis TaxID=614101 RepID=A0ABQ9GVM6_9NEOP|nr:hypothetical protein PR048_023999 [Dryococelus australis]